jgi:predicted nuclease of predicted toxin-antitoxin system
MEIRFHLDEHIDHEVATGLRTRGIDVTTATDAGLLHSGDQDHLRYALDSQRIVFTNDQDFLRLHSQGVPHAGIVFCARGSRSTKEIIRHLALLHDCMTADEMHGRIEFF